jgi:hypothetical protein
MNEMLNRVLKYIVYLLPIGFLVILAGCFTVDERGVRDPVREAEATRVVLAAQDESARRAIERQVVEAQAEQAWVEAEAVRSALPAATLRNTLMYMGVGVGALVLVVGSAFACVAWLNKRATSVYPNNAGQYPVIVKRTWGGVTIVHDPNRALGPTTIYTTPSVAGWVWDKARPLAAAQFPAAGGEGSLLQLATQAQAIGLMAAATRKSGSEDTARHVEQLAQALINRPVISAPLPPVQVSPLEVSHVERLLLERNE